MNKLAYKAATTATTAALLLSSLAPIVAADTTVEISGNGANSDNEANVEIVNETAVFQNNEAKIKNDVNVNANSGNNDASFNTGGDVVVDTGDADADVNVDNKANVNVAEVDGCCPKDVTVKISGNGFESDNDANLAVANETFVEQNNYAKVKNKVEVDVDTGNNTANFNTGGDVDIKTGNAKANDGVTITNAVNKNVAQVGGGNSGSVWVEISGNGANSDNEANVEIVNQTAVYQNNNAKIKNDVYVWANSGNNDASFNTGGDVVIDTGKASVDVNIDNLANFNAADVDACGCLLDLTVKIKDNGFESDNEANVALASLLYVDQNNEFSCKKHHGWFGELIGWPWKKGKCNDVHVDVDTGNNTANFNTDEGEPAIITGDADADVSVATEANANVLGDVDLGDIELPDFDLPSSISGLLVLLLGLFG